MQWVFGMNNPAQIETTMSGFCGTILSQVWKRSIISLCTTIRSYCLFLAFFFIALRLTLCGPRYPTGTTPPDFKIYLTLQSEICHTTLSYGGMKWNNGKNFRIVIVSRCTSLVVYITGGVHHLCTSLVYITGVHHWWCTSLVVYITGVHHWWCTSLVYITGGVHHWWCTSLVVYITGGVHHWWCTSLVVYITVGVHHWWCTSLVVYITGGVHHWWCTSLVYITVHITVHITGVHAVFSLENLIYT